MSLEMPVTCMCVLSHMIHPLLLFFGRPGGDLFSASGCRVRRDGGRGSSAREATCSYFAEGR